MLFTLKLLCLVMGLCLISYIVLSFEDEEKVVRSWLDTAWQSLRAKDHALSLRLNQLLATLAAGTIRLFNRIYGERLLSFRAFLMGFWLNITCILLLFTAGIPFYIGDNSNPPMSLREMASLFVFFVIACFMVLLGLYWSTTKFVHFQGAFLGSMLLSGLFSAVTGPSGDPQDTTDEMMALMLTLGLALDFLVIAVARALLGRVAASASLRLSLLLLVGICVVFPLALLGTTELVVSYFPPVAHHDVRFMTRLGLVVCGLVAVITASTIFVVVACCLAIGIASSVAPRTLHAVVKMKLLENRKVTVGLGILLIAVWYPDAAAALANFMKLVFA